jgi:hypothetical protein
MPELPQYHGPRWRLELGKYRVLRVQKAPIGFSISLDLNGRLIVISAPSNADVHEGDLLTLYTEVPLDVPRKPDA